MARETLAHQPLCFVLMPFGDKPSSGGTIAFDAVYEQVIVPAIEAAAMQPIRADEEQVGGVIHKPMFERLLLVRRPLLPTSRRRTPTCSVLLFAEGRGQLTFDVGLLRALPYQAGQRGADPRCSERTTAGGAASRSGLCSIPARERHLRRDARACAPIAARPRRGRGQGKYRFHAARPRRASAAYGRRARRI